MGKTKICVLGHFGEGLNLLNGQTVKTKIVTDELSSTFGESNVKKIDTHGGVKTLIKSPIHSFKAMKSNENVVIFPAHNGLRVYAPLLAFFKKFFKKTKLHYCVIGGWLPAFLDDKKGLEKALKKFDAIYVETNSMKNALQSKGFQNVYIVPNCKPLDVLKKEELCYTQNKPFKLCTFSRVMKEKGIEDAVNAVKFANEKFGETIFTLDIYGQVDSAQTEWFEQLKKDFPDYVNYGGLVPFDRSVKVLKEYFALLFPTYYEGEGFAGTIIDAFSAGVPVISSTWKYNGEIINNGENGFLFETHNTDELSEILCKISSNPQIINAMKTSCIDAAAKYVPKEALSPLIENIK